MEPTIERPRVVSREEWLRERRAHLEREKELTRASDRLAEERRALPWVRIEKEYAFDAPRGRVTLSDLFQGRSQLVLTHFMFGPGWKEGCVGCSFGADHMAGARLHLEQHDVSIVYVSRAPLAEIEPFQRRMGWTFPWVSSSGCDFNYDFAVSFTPDQVARRERAYNFGTTEIDGEDLSGVSVFYRDDEGRIFHTYSTFGRGSEKNLGAYMYLDLTPKGRNESPSGNLTDWVRHHDRYGAGGIVLSTGRYRADTPAVEGSSV
jgi:predicted dithiol-disulfide oxidoreductase (DUF899 family)